MSKSYWIFCLCMLAMTSSYGKERTDAEMKQIALKSLCHGNNNAKGTSKTNLNLACVMKNRVFSVYTAEDAGFVIVSADDEAKPVLGYSTSSFDPSNIPCGLECWMNEIAAAQPRQLSPRKENVSPIEPIVKTSWGQGDPYNLLSPVVNGRKTATGCVATAMAQIINANQYPDSVSFKGKYYLGADGVNAYYEQVDSRYIFPMLPTYTATDQLTPSYTDEEVSMVATLMRDCGYSADMRYGEDAQGQSGAVATNAAYGLFADFNYPARSLKIFNADYFSSEEWFGMLRRELEMGSPVLYCARDINYGGHAFVVDGMDEDGLVHVNWGWDGSFNGYYYLNSMLPSSFNYSLDHQMITGIRQVALPEDELRSQFYCTIFTLTSNTLGFEVYMDECYNFSPYIYSGSIYLVGENVETGEVKSRQLASGTLNPYYRFKAGNYPAVISWPAGKYKVYLATKNSSFVEDFSPVREIGGPIYYDVTIEGKRMSYHITIDDEAKPLSTSIHDVKMCSNPTDDSSNILYKVYFDLQGRRVTLDEITNSSSHRGVIIEQQHMSNGEIITKKVFR